MIVAGVLDLVLIRGCTFEAQTLTMEDSLGNPVDITGMIPFAQVRAQPGDPVIIDLQPVITGVGVVTLARIDAAVTPQYIPNVYEWDFVLNNPANDDDTQQILFGKFYIKNKISA